MTIRNKIIIIIVTMMIVIIIIFLLFNIKIYFILNKIVNIIMKYF